jgi:glutamate-1-semialdehyde 2,1-aminomutase
MMLEMEEIFFSFTMGGETLSLAAALATMKKIVAEPVINTMQERGERLLAGLSDRLKRHRVDFLSLSGHPSWSFLSFADASGATSWEIKTLWLQEVFERGILSLGTHNISYAHSNEDIDRLLAVYDEVLPFIAAAVRDGAVRQYLRCEPMVPLFRVR